MHNRDNNLGSSCCWYVAQCKPLRELQASAVLRGRLGLSAYVAEVSKWVRGEEKQSPFFPGYIFVQADLGQVTLSSINSTPGVVRLLEFGGALQTVPDSVIEMIRERVDSFNAEGGLPAHEFQPGDTVLLKSGPLKGLEAVFISPTTPGARVKVLLQFLGRLNEVQVEVDDLEKVQAAPQNTPPAPLERRTRGRGRPIKG